MVIFGWNLKSLICKYATWITRVLENSLNQMKQKCIICDVRMMLFILISTWSISKFILTRVIRDKKNYSYYVKQKRTEAKPWNRMILLGCMKRKLGEMFITLNQTGYLLDKNGFICCSYHFLNLCREMANETIFIFWLTFLWMIYK